MKSITPIACTLVVIFSLTAFTYSNWNGKSTDKISYQTTKVIEPPTFFYNLSPRYKNTITKERMHIATTISDLIPEYSIQESLKNKIISLRDVVISIEEEGVDHTKHRSEKGEGNSLSKEQKDLLQSTDYSTNFFLEGYATDNNLQRDVNKDRYFNYSMTVIPENQATYKAGNDALMDFLTTRSQPTIAKIQRGNLKPGKISFTVTKAGIISNIDISSTCGYPSVDERMMELLNKLPDVWNVATNGKGEKVNQTLVFSYGQVGC